MHVVFGYYENNKTQKKPNMLAIIDDGHGMDPEMIRVASIWGGTHRENDRDGFGRYGYGLPSACVSIGKQFRVISKVVGGKWNQVIIDVDDIGDGKYLDESGKVIVPHAKEITLPSWISKYIKDSIGGMDHGTVIIIDKVDRLDFSTSKALKDLFLQHFGITYRNYLRNINIFVDGSKVHGIDPLFLTPGLRYFDEDDEKAEALPELAIDIKDKETKELIGTIKARFSLMPPTFLREKDDKLKERGKNNLRFPIRKENNGIIILRKGRQIDVVYSKCPWTTFQNNDRYIGIELDFPPALDEEFSMTTSKQQVVIRERIWDILKENGIYRAMQDMRQKWQKLSSELDKTIIEKSGKAELAKAEDAMLESKKYFNQNPETPKQQEQKQKNFEKEVKERAEKQNKKVEDVRRELESEIKDRPYKIYECDVPEGSPFYWAEQIGGQTTVYLNKSHRFYTDVYAASNATSNMKDAIKILLYVLSECELNSIDDIRNFYQGRKV